MLSVLTRALCVLVIETPQFDAVNRDGSAFEEKAAVGGLTLTLVLVQVLEIVLQHTKEVVDGASSSTAAVV